LNLTWRSEETEGKSYSTTYQRGEKARRARGKNEQIRKSNLVSSTRKIPTGVSTQRVGGRESGDMRGEKGKLLRKLKVGGVVGGP